MFEIFYFSFLAFTTDMANTGHPSVAEQPVTAHNNHLPQLPYVVVNPMPVAPTWTVRYSSKHKRFIRW